MIIFCFCVALVHFSWLPLMFVLCSLSSFVKLSFLLMLLQATVGTRLQSQICRALPMFIPRWLAPLGLPYCKLIVALPSSEISSHLMSAT